MNEMMISDKPARQVNGLYCLNDLHRASGGAKRHEVTNWRNLQQTVELIDEISKPEISGLKQNQQVTSKVGNPTLKQNQEVIRVIHGGTNRGTYACR